MRYDVEYYNYNSNPDQPGIDYWTYDEEKEFTIALGASIGQKWINKKGWTFEINFGVAFSFNKLSLTKSSSILDGSTIHLIPFFSKIFFLTKLFDAKIISSIIFF